MQHTSSTRQIDTRENTGGWALVLAPAQDGWRMKGLPWGGRLAMDGHIMANLDDMVDVIRLLAPLLREDRRWQRLFLHGDQSRPPVPIPTQGNSRPGR